MTNHDFWEQLAAGHALSALEPEEEQAFTTHLRDCLRCRELSGDFAVVAAQLGTLLDATDAPSWQQIRPAIHAAAPVVLLERRHARRRRMPMLLSAAAGLALVTAGGIVIAQTQGSTGIAGAQNVALQSCAQQPGCRLVHLSDKASLLIADGDVRVLPTALTPPPPNHVYVLWQLPRDGRPMLLVATLNETGNGVVGEQHALAISLANTAAFGLSLEPTNSVPTQPTDVVAVGTA